MKTFFTSDLHFGHANVIKYSLRPFADVDAMNAALVNNWNAVVGADDRVFILGDLSFLPQSMLVYYLGAMNGRKCLFTGTTTNGCAKRRRFYSFLTMLWTS